MEGPDGGELNLTPHPRTAHARPLRNQILEKGMDPQLEAALLILKTRLLASQLALARADD